MKKKESKSAPTNPFLLSSDSTPKESSASEESSEIGSELELTGPQSPELAVVTALDSDEVIFPSVTTDPGPLLHVVGLHGGAGCTSVAELFGEDARESPFAWPISADADEPLNVIAVARTHYRGLTEAERFAHSWARGDLASSRLLGLVLIDDGPRLTRGQLGSVRRLRRMTPHGWHIQWSEAWRLQQPEISGAPALVRLLVKRIRSLASAPTEGK